MRFTISVSNPTKEQLDVIFKELKDGVGFGENSAIPFVEMDKFGITICTNFWKKDLSIGAIESILRDKNVREDEGWPYDEELD